MQVRVSSCGGWTVLAKSLQGRGGVSKSDWFNSLEEKKILDTRSWLLHGWHADITVMFQLIR